MKLLSILTGLCFTNLLFANVSDRPGAGDSASTQENKTWRLETGILNYTKDTKSKSYSLAPNAFLVRGFAQSELQMGWSRGFTRSKLNEQGWKSDWGNISLRYKYGFGQIVCENCEFGIIAGLIIPEKSDSFLKRASKQLSIPMAFKLSEKFDLGVNVGLESLSNQVLDEYLKTQSSMVLGVSVDVKLGFFVQQTYSTNIEDSNESSFQLGAGAFYQLAPKLQVDVEVNKGLSSIDKSTSSAFGFTYWIN